MKHREIERGPDHLIVVEGEEAFTMEPGGLHIVESGVNHRVCSTEECSILLIENKSTAHLGDTESEIAKPLKEQLEGYGESHHGRARYLSAWSRPPRGS